MPSINFERNDFIPEVESPVANAVPLAIAYRIPNGYGAQTAIASSQATVATSRAMSGNYNESSPTISSPRRVNNET